MVLDKIIAIVAEQFQMDADEITEDTVLSEIGADDMDVADLVLAVEDAFDMDVTIEQANALRTVGDLADLAEDAVRQSE
jgi:acyl carrier protein